VERGKEIGNSVIAPAVVILPTAATSVNQRAPSGPGTIVRGWLLVVGVAYSVIVGLWPKVTPTSETRTPIAANRTDTAALQSAGNRPSRSPPNPLSPHLRGCLEEASCFHSRVCRIRTPLPLTGRWFTSMLRKVQTEQVTAGSLKRRTSERQRSKPSIGRRLADLRSCLSFDRSRY
jgi:hypothetical protein